MLDKGRAGWPANYTKINNGIQEKDAVQIIDGLFEDCTTPEGRFEIGEFDKIRLAVTIGNIRKKLAGGDKVKLDDIAELFKQFEIKGSFSLEPGRFEEFRSKLKTFIDDNMKS